MNINNNNSFINSNNISNNNSVVTLHKDKEPDSFVDKSQPSM